MSTETRRFEAEVSEVLKLVTHSLYSHKEIFLRELVSNASDACDKRRFAALSQPELAAREGELGIEIEFDANAKTLTVIDHGIGMSRDEVIENIGTVARSGTKRFLEALSGDARKDAQLIGQFGVGFYSAFVVADKVSLVTRRAGLGPDEAVRWESDGSSEYSIEPAEMAEVGSRVTLHLKPEETEFLSRWRLSSLVSKYSDHIGFPIRMRVEKDGQPGDEWETVNHAAALWARPKAELQDADYQSFYKHVTHAFDDALAWSHNRVEGNQNYISLLYLPSQAPFDQVFSGRDDRKGLKLYIRRVFIMDASEQLLPSYLRFVRGVVDSDDLPLNVSREILQENRLVQQIRTGLTKRTLDLLDKLANDEKDKYATFWTAFGNVLKEGVTDDYGNRERIAKLLRFASTRNADATQDVSLDDYIARMKEGQAAIYYVTADSHAAAKGSPLLEALRARDIEVLLLTDRVDEWMMGQLTEYAGKKLRHAGKGELELGDLADSADAARREERNAAAAPLVERLKADLGERVADVRASERLVDSPSCIALGEHDMALYMQRLLKQAGHETGPSRPVLEINPEHALLRRYAAETDAARSADLALILLEQAQLAEGGQLDDPSAYVRRVNALLTA